MIPDLVQDIKLIAKSYPNNIMAATFDAVEYSKLDKFGKRHIRRIVNSGIQNPNSHLGAYAMFPDDYDKYPWLFNPLVQTYNHVGVDFRQESNWDLQGDFDLKKIDPAFENVSMRVRVARNTTEFPLPGAMNKKDRVNFENRMTEVFKILIANPDFGGRYMSLTPESEYQITDTEYKALVAGHKMFKDMSADPYLEAAGISADWPYGRGIYESANSQMIVWVNEEDQLRIISMAMGSDLSIVFKNLKRLLDTVEASGLTFAVSQKFGNVTSCPTNIGTGMRASVLLKLPKLTKDEAHLKEIAKKYKLSVRGMGGEHTAYGEDGLTDVSPSDRAGVTEAEIMRNLYEGLVQMQQEELAA